MATSFFLVRNTQTSTREKLDHSSLIPFFDIKIRHQGTKFFSNFNLSLKFTDYQQQHITIIRICFLIASGYSANGNLKAV